MGKVKELFFKQGQIIKEELMKFKVSVSVSVVLSVLISMGMTLSLEGTAKQIYNIIWQIGMIWGVGTLFIEAIFQTKQKKKMIGYIVTFLIASLFVGISRGNKVLWNTTFEMVLIGYIFTLIILTISILIKNTKKDLGEYLICTISNLIKVSFIYLILVIGSTILYAICISLLIRQSGFELLGQIQVLILGIFYVPSIIYSISYGKEEKNKFMKILLYYVIFPLVIIATVIVYIYMIKIFVVGEIPNNTIYRILISLFIVAYPVYQMIPIYLEKESKFNRVIKILEYAFIPLILLEIYAIGIRITEYGLTTTRYFSIILILVQIIALFFSLFKNKKYLNQVLIPIAVLIILITMTPLNVIDLPGVSQKYVLETLLPTGKNFEDLTEKEKARVADIYQYLRGQNIEEKYLPKDWSEETKNKIKEYRKTYGYSSFETKSINERNEKEIISINGYQTMREIRVYKNSFKETYELQQENGMYIEKIEMEDYLKNLIKQNEIGEEELDTYFQNHDIISISENEDLYIKNISINYNIENEEINSVLLTGYLLGK